MLLLPGVVDAMVELVEAELSPVFASLAQTIQPLPALVSTVTVRGVGLVVTDPVDNVPSASVLALKAKLKACGTVALTAIWSSLMLTVLYDAVSIVVGTLSRVVIVPAFELVALDFTCTAAALVQLKQYNVPTVKSVLGKVTVWLVTLVAVPIPGHAVPPDGQAKLVVLTVKVPAAPKVYPVGNTTCTLASVEAVVGLAQTMPVV